MTLHEPHPDSRIDLILDDVRYLRTKMDRMEEKLHGIMWKVVGIGAGSGAVGFVVALVATKMLSL
jgi:hypothetical protein